MDIPGSQHIRTQTLVCKVILLTRSPDVMMVTQKSALDVKGFKLFADAALSVEGLLVHVWHAKINLCMLCQY